MGLTVAVQSEDGKELMSVGDPTNILHRVLPSVNDPKFHHLNRVDWYGDTTFNAVQMKDVREELHRLKKGIETPEGLALPEELALLARIDELITYALDRPHRYLKFIGD